MPNDYFQFKQFTIRQGECSMKVTTDACLFGAWVADEIQDNDPIKNILDIGSGSGLLSLMLAQKSPALIDGIEIQPTDYRQALQNIAASPFNEQIRLHNANALDFSYRKKYDIIISNPPFYENDLKSSHRNKNIAHHSMELKLADLLYLIAKQLREGGKFYLLLPAKRKQELMDLLPAGKLFINQVTAVHQTGSHPPFRIMVRGSFKASAVQEQSITIANEHAYGPEFIRLLSHYYLNL